MSEPPDDGWLDQDLEVDEAGAGEGLAAVISLRDRMAVGSVATAFARGDHVEVARAFVRELAHAGETVFTEGAWWRYSNELGVFRELSGAKLELVVQSYAGCAVGKRGILKMRSSDVNGIIKVASSQVWDGDFFVGAPRGITFKNAFVVAGNEKIFEWPLKRENRARHCYPFPYSRGSAPVHFIEFLSSSFLGDEDAAEKIALIREFAAMSILGEATRFQLALILSGEGSNGKGVLFKLLKDMMPPKSVVSIAPQHMSQEYRAAMLAGKMLNLVSEMPEADIMDSEAFKAAVAGDQMEGRHIREAPFYFTPIAAHIYSANTLPATRDQSHGFWRRIAVVTFNRQFGPEDADPYLYDKLKSELPAIVSWCLDAAPRVLGSGSYTIPSSSLDAKDKWMRSTNHVIQYLEECTDNAGPLDVGTKSSDLYINYRDWSIRYGYKPIATNTFGERMRRQGKPAEKKRDSNYYPVVLKSLW